MAYCTNCGAHIDDNVKFCPNCGAPVQKAAPEPGPKENESPDGQPTNVQATNMPPASDSGSASEGQTTSDHFHIDHPVDQHIEVNTAGQASESQPGASSESHQAPFQETRKFEASGKSQKKHHPIRNILIPIAVIVVLVIIIGTVSANHSSKDTTASVEEGAANTAYTGSPLSSYTSASDNSDFAAVVDKSEEDEKLQPIDLQVGSLAFKIPGYYTESSESDENTHMYSYELNNDGSVIVISTSSANGINSVQFRDNGEEMLDQIVNSIDTTDGTAEITKSEQTEYMGMPGYACDVKGTYEGMDMSVDLDIFLDESQNQIDIFLFGVYGNPKRDVSSDYINMMKTAERTETIANSDSNVSGSSASAKAKTSTANADSSSDSFSSSQKSDPASGVSPDVKSVLDSYEKLMNDYCDFMEKYKNADSSDAISMLSDYYKMLDEYTEAMSELDELDTSTMSTADYEYYLDVTNRISKRLLEVGQ